MTAQQKYEHWLDIAKYDLETAKVEYFDDKLPVPMPEEISDFFDTLSAYYLNNRYPDFVSKLSSQIKEAEATKILSQTEEVFSWLLTLKP